METHKVHHQSFVWGEAQVRELKHLKSKGYSAAQIAKQMGHGLTRNAIIAKLDRIGFTKKRMKRKDQDVPKSGRRSERTREESSEPVNVARAKMDLSPPEYLAVRRFSWEASDAQPNA